ncbi:hypothetical protein PT2222_120006 [Paraburkholderia tropica]
MMNLFNIKANNLKINSVATFYRSSIAKKDGVSINLGKTVRKEPIFLAG